MNEQARQQLDYLLERAESAARSSHPDAVSSATRWISGAMTMLVSLGHITTPEAEEWRARLRPHLGANFGVRRCGRTVAVVAGAEREPAEAAPSADAEVRSAYVFCRNVSLARLAIMNDTAADPDHIAKAIAARAEPEFRERMLRACRVGFEDRGKPVVDGNRIAGL